MIKEAAIDALDWVTVNAGMIGLIFFFGFFMLMLLWVFRPGAGSTYQNHANIPLKESDNE